METCKTRTIVQAVLKKQEASPDLLANRTGSSHHGFGTAAQNRDSDDGSCSVQNRLQLFSSKTSKKGLEQEKKAARFFSCPGFSSYRNDCYPGLNSDMSLTING